jgi:acyl carrier protein
MKTLDEIRAWLVARVAKLAALPPDRIDTTKEFPSFGISSVRLTQMSGELEDLTGARVDPAVFWDHSTIDALADYLAEAR